jgi:hypothetical protein
LPKEYQQCGKNIPETIMELSFEKGHIANIFRYGDDIA